MLLKTTMMLGEFLSVKLGDWLLRANRPRVGHEAWHADPLKENERPVKPTLNLRENACQDFVTIRCGDLPQSHLDSQPACLPRATGTTDRTTKIARRTD